MMPFAGYGHTSAQGLQGYFLQLLSKKREIICKIQKTIYLCIAFEQETS